MRTLGTLGSLGPLGSLGTLRPLGMQRSLGTLGSLGTLVMIAVNCLAANCLWAQAAAPDDPFWAYRPVVKPVTQAHGAAAVDELLQLHWKEGLSVAPPASAEQFIRRASFDLTGLPPTAGEVDAFRIQYQSQPDAAVRDLVERLLESPHYGERMAQHWLDVTRYADSSGLANDYHRGNAWRYRDYVVRSFNLDKPYDQFILEQIAGDEIDESNSEQLIATGFLRMGPWELTGMEVARVARQRFLDDVTNSIGETFLGQALQCARCHDHKFDPIPTRDYYSMQAALVTTQLTERPAPFLPEENLSGFDEAESLLETQAELQSLMQQLDDKALRAVDDWYAQHKLDRTTWDAALEKVKAASGNKRRGLYAATRNQLLRDNVPEDQFPPRMLGWSPKEIGLERIANKGLERLNWQLDTYQPYALSVYSGTAAMVTSVNAPMRMPKDRTNAGPVDECYVLDGGDPFALGEPVKPGVLTALDAIRSGVQPLDQVSLPESAQVVDQVSSSDAATANQRLPEALVGRRLALAKWIAQSNNPLTTRVIANRVWLWHFGQPIAANPNNFGSTGKRPTHPELLDWLAASLVEQNWSIKSLHRLIMNSQTYRRSSLRVSPPEASASESDHGHSVQERLASYAIFPPRRLTAEELRDAMLVASGEINLTLGGIPVRPEINQEVALQPRQVMGTFAAAWVPSPLPQQRHRRSLYTLKLRGLVDPAFEVFNAPAADFSCERREESTITPQALTLLNSQNSHARALALAARAIQDSSSNRAALQRCYQLVLGRSPDQEELQLCETHLAKMQAIESRFVPPRIEPLLEIQREAIEENTGERFQYTERLVSNRQFQHDLQPADCDARVRGLAHVCLVLFNSSEFLYVY